MLNTKVVPATFLAVALTLGAVVVANAQDTTAVQETPTVQDDTEQVTPVDVRGEHGPRGERGERDGRGPRDGGMMNGLMEQIDADGDNSITLEEIAAFRTAQVTGADTSGDGNLSLEEFQTIFAGLMQERMVDAFQHLDADGDGSVTPVELDTQVDRMVERMDRNGDGAINEDDRAGHGPRGQRG